VKQNGGVDLLQFMKALEYYQNNDEVMMLAVDNKPNALKQYHSKRYNLDNHSKRYNLNIIMLAWILNILLYYYIFTFLIQLFFRSKLSDRIIFSKAAH
jgi:hypothetical protein